MHPPHWRLAPRDRDHQAAQPRPPESGARGPGRGHGKPRPPPLPPFPPPPADSWRPFRGGGGPTPPLRGPGHPGGEARSVAISAARRVPPVGRPLTPAVPAAGR